MLILAIDQSIRSTGIVVINDKEEIIDTAVAGYALEGAKTQTDQTQRYLKIALAVINMAKKHNPTIIAMEGYGISSKKGRIGDQFKLAELGGIIKANLFLSLKQSPSVVPPASWKKVIVGNGRAKKPEITKFFQSKYKLDKQDLYDALGIGLYVLRITKGA